MIEARPPVTDEDDPADSIRDPEPLKPPPTETYIEPDLPLNEEPELRYKEPLSENIDEPDPIYKAPLFPILDVPVLKTTKPLDPERPEFAVDNKNDPLDEDEP